MPRPKHLHLGDPEQSLSTGGTIGTESAGPHSLGILVPNSPGNARIKRPATDPRVSRNTMEKTHNRKHCQGVASRAAGTVPTNKMILRTCFTANILKIKQSSPVSTHDTELSRKGGGCPGEELPRQLPRGTERHAPR